uniref:C2H2-type domain-containing protein n=1 Tax=Oryza brachyantha TaxID=4533 RepID=J3M078_ORYBR
MRAHGVGDGDGLGVDDDGDDDDSLGDDRWNSGVPSSSAGATHVYALRTKPNRLTRSRQVCKNCGKEFTSWEHFLEHGKCNSGEDEDDEEPDRSLQSWSPEAKGEENPGPSTGWSKGKRSRRAKSVGIDSSPPASACMAGEEEDLANCLVLLSSSKLPQPGISQAQPEPESSVSGSKEYNTPMSCMEPAFNTVMMLLPSPTSVQYVSPTARGMFECKACKKVFSSHQALGGHRASHKKVKGCFAARLDSNITEPPQHSGVAHANTNATFDASNTDGDANAGTSEAAAELSMAIVPRDPPVAALAAAPLKKKGKMHECSVCHRLFTSGQALGGHKRCHWLTSNSADHASSIANLPPLPPADDLIGASCHPLHFRPMMNAPEPALNLGIAANPSPLASRSKVGGSSLHPDATPPVASPTTVPHRDKATAITGSQNAKDAVGLSVVAEDEADSTTVKRARLRDLKDVSMAGETTPWLQVGIGSSSRGSGDDNDRQ